MKKEFCSETCDKAQACFVARGFRINSQKVEKDLKNYKLEEKNVPGAIDQGVRIAKIMGCTKPEELEESAAQYRQAAQIVFSRERLVKKALQSIKDEPEITGKGPALFYKIYHAMKKNKP